MSTYECKEGKTDTGTYLMAKGGRRVRTKKLPIRYYIYYLGGEIICKPNLSDMQFTYTWTPESKLK